MTERRSRFPRVYYRSARRPSALLSARPRAALEGSATLADYCTLDDFSFQAEEPLLLDDAASRLALLHGPILDDPPVPANGQLRVTEADAGIFEIEAVMEESCRVLLEAGFLFRGGAQDRMLTTATLLAGPTRARLGVHCVEQGRWEADQRQFNSGGHLPDLLRFQLECAAENEVGVRQSQLWQAIRDALTGMEVTGPTQNASDWQSQARALPTVLPEEPTLRGALLSDDRLGLSSLHLVPGLGFRASLELRLAHERAWRGLFSERVTCAREFYRIYDQGRRLALRTTADGTALRDLKGNFILFEYSEHDLEHSFQPPLEGPAPAIPGPKLERRRAWSGGQLLRCLPECRVEQTGQGDRWRSLRLVHPEWPLVGQGLVDEREGLVSLDVQALATEPAG